MEYPGWIDSASPYFQVAEADPMSVQNSLDHPPILDRQLFRAGKVIFRQGSEGECAYVIQSGSVDIVLESNGDKMCLGRLTHGAIFGEMALIDDSPRMASAIAADACNLIVIRKALFKEKLAAADPFIARLLGLFVNNIRNITTAHTSHRPFRKWHGQEAADGETGPESAGPSLTKAPFIRRG